MKILEDYFGNCKVILLDIETTGLVSEKNKVILGGLLVFSENPSDVIQFFSETKADEKQILGQLIPFLASADIIVSYNGNAFDLPFLNKRLLKNGFHDQIPLYKSFDLYRLFRKSSFSKILPNLKQKTVEDYMGISFERTDPISGKQCIFFYQAYQKTKDSALKEAILLHNRDDLFQLHKLMDLLKNLDLHEAMYHNGFNIIDADKKINISQIRFSPRSLIAKGFHFGIPMDFVQYSEPYKVDLSILTQSVCIEIPFIKKANSIYVDLTEFNLDIQGFEKFSGYQSGYLILKNGKEICYTEINQLIKRICREILSNF